MLFSTHRARTNVADPSLLDDIVESAHDFFVWDIWVQTMDLKDINKGPKPLHTGLYSVEYMFAGESDTVDKATIIDSGCPHIKRWLTRKACTPAAFGHDYNSLSGYLVLDERLANNFLGSAIGVQVSLVFVNRIFAARSVERTVSQVLIPMLYACSNKGSASSSSRTHFAHCFVPYDIAPKMILETLRPELPKRLYSICVGGG